MDVTDAEAGELLTALLEELRALRQETARQTALLEAMLAKLAEIERTQSS
jgi:transposase